MRKKILLLVLVALTASACREETVSEKVERKVRNAADKIENAADELK